MIFLAMFIKTEFTDKNNKRAGKRFAKKRVRKLALSEDALGGGKSAQYKKVYPQYDICDYYGKDYIL